MFAMTYFFSVTGTVRPLSQMYVPPRLILRYGLWGYAHVSRASPHLPKNIRGPERSLPEPLNHGARNREEGCRKGRVGKGSVMQRWKRGNTRDKEKAPRAMVEEEARGIEDAGEAVGFCRLQPSRFFPQGPGARRRRFTALWSQSGHSQVTIRSHSGHIQVIGFNVFRARWSMAPYKRFSIEM